jgi:hypothetical protein
MTPCFTAYADVIFEPQNDFFERNREQLNYYVRTFIANGADGFAALKNEPGARTNTGRIQNGETVQIEWTCLYDGEYWAYSPYRHSGWIKVDELLVPYDYIAFEEEYGDKFYRYAGDFAELTEAGSALLWSWPGTDAEPWELKNIDTEHFNMMDSSSTYMDKDGREWLYIGYYFGKMTSWICLSDPMNPDIPAFNPAPEPVSWGAPRTAHTEIQATAKSSVVIIIVLVAVSVIGTAVLIKVFWKPVKLERNENADGDRE